ncbi:monooxygenase AflN [Cyphellophora attinorum]|uniref:Monooxygenase AflN n=1 Tax=Cyphellophora attinorum TaxID=1664694 RepID=A0A0N1NXT5_9EURO|nr:monooxygenase AflN [Phialophora attinorum]KPI37536.1 monooxygenase AflN [Phialophora attinorum]
MSNFLASHLLWVFAFIACIKIAQAVLKGYRVRKLVHDIPEKYGIPTLPHSMLWGHLAELGKLMAQYPSDIHGQYMPTLLMKHHPEVCKYDACYLDLWPVVPPSIFVFNPDMMRQFCQEPSLPKHDLIQWQFGSWTQGNDLALQHGEAWKKWRSILNPGFSAKNITSLVPAMLEEVLDFRQCLEGLAATGETFILEDVATKLTVDVIGRVALGVRLKSLTAKNALYTALRNQVSWTATHFSPMGLQKLLNPMRYYFTWRNDRAFRKVCLPGVIAGIESQVPKGASKTMTDLVIAAYTKDCSTIAPLDPHWLDVVVSQFKIFFFAGHDSTTATLCFVYAYLNENPTKLALVREEMNLVLGKSGLQDSIAIISRSPEILSQLTYTTAAIKETLRLQPTVGSVRQAPEDFFLIHPETGTRLPVHGFMLQSASSAEQRMAKYFPRPHEFIPERFLAREGEELYVRKNTYRPFELGPRNCIGQEHAMTEIRLILALTIRDMDIVPQYPSDAPPLFGSQLYQESNEREIKAHPRLGLPAKIVLRDQNSRQSA